MVGQRGAPEIVLGGVKQVQFLQYDPRLYCFIYKFIDCFVMAVGQTLAFLLLLQLATAISTSPAWVINPNFNAGQVVVVDQTNTSTFLPPNTTNVVKTQNFATAFSGPQPRVILSLLGYGQFEPASASLRLGFKIVVTTITVTAFKYNISTFDVTTALLRYNYLGIQYETTSFYTSTQSLNFNSATNLGNNSASSRYQLTTLAYPAGQTNPNYPNPQFILQAYPIGFCLIPNSYLTYFSLNATAFNSSHYVLNISTMGNISLTELDFNLISFDRGLITANYSVYIDLVLNNVIGNSSFNYGDIINPSQYMYRNGMMGGVHVQFQLTLVPTNAIYYYYNASSTSNDLIVFRGFNNRVVKCPTAYYYSPAAVLCYDVCPNGTYTNTTYSLCLPCYYACVTCSTSNLSNACTSCSSANYRTLSANNTCDCVGGYFDTGVSLCTQCDSTCLTCSGATNISCLTCDVTKYRALSNSSCLCQTGYYQNVTCLSCSQNSTGCTSCSFLGTSFKCLTCDSTLFRALDATNTLCPCISGYYQNQNHVCTPCSVLGCLNCNFNSSNSTQICLVCDSSSHWVLNNSICQCAGNYLLQNGNCVLSNDSSANNQSSVCGNGILDNGQQCDDNNTQNFDGCSSSCRVQANHSCVNNSTLLSYSICYYSSQIIMNTTLVYKYPNENRVKLELRVQAPGCNLKNLKKYLQTTVYLQLVDKSNTRRLLNYHNTVKLANDSWTYISTKSISFDDSSQILIIVFQYDASIDLTQKSINLLSSNSVQNQAIKYFFLTPDSVLQLQQPYNGLSTTYYSDSQRTQFAMMTYAFYATVALSWIFFIIAFIFQRGAIATENILVLQMSYLTLVDNQNVLECWGGLQLAGKYTFGFNPSVFLSYLRTDQLIIGLQVNTFNNFSLIFSVNVILWVAMLILLRRLRLVEQKVIEKQLAINQSQNEQKKQEDKPRSEYSQPQNKTSMSRLQRITAVIIDLYLTLNFVIACGFIISLAFSTLDVIITNSIVGILFVATNVVFWVLYQKKGTMNCFQGVSFVSVLQVQKKLSERCKFLIKFYYLSLYICLLISGILIFLLRQNGLVLYILLEVSFVAMVSFLLKLQVYKQRMDKLRAIFNIIILSIIILTHILSQQIQTTLGSGFAVVLVVILLLLLQLLINILVSVLIIRKAREEEKEQVIQQLQMKQLINELGVANISFLDQIGYRSLRNQDKQHSGKILINGSFYDELQASLNNSHREGKIKEVLLDKVSEFKDLKKTLKKQIELHNMGQMNNNLSFSLEQPELKYKSSNSNSSKAMQVINDKSLHGKESIGMGNTTLFHSSSKNKALSNSDEIINDTQSQPENSQISQKDTEKMANVNQQLEANKISQKDQMKRVEINEILGMSGEIERKSDKSLNVEEIKESI